MEHWDRNNDQPEQPRNWDEAAEYTLGQCNIGDDRPNIRTQWNKGPKVIDQDA